MSYKKKNKEIEKQFNKLEKEISLFIELQARGVLKKHPYFDEFVMAMGSAGFTYKNPDRQAKENHPACKQFFKFLNQWDDIFHITGETMRFTATGKKHVHWGLVPTGSIEAREKYLDELIK